MAIFFIKNFYITLGLLVFASFFLAMLEPTTEAYFFDITSKTGEENKFYGPYNTSLEIGFIIGKIIPAIILIFLPFNYIFLAFAAFFLILFLLSFRARRIIEDKH
jgi:MFS family permease